jgi:hypothetical protein
LRRAIGQPFFALSGSARPLKVVYHALVDRLIEPADVNAHVPVHEIPDDVLHYLTPTRYCEPTCWDDAGQLFGRLLVYARVQAICEDRCAAT